MGKRPKLSRSQRAKNREQMNTVFSSLSKHCLVRVNTPYHWTLMFSNRRRVEVYPSNFGFHNVGRKLRYLSGADEVVYEASRFAALPALKETVELIEDE